MSTEISQESLQAKPNKISAAQTQAYNAFVRRLESHLAHYQSARLELANYAMAALLADANASHEDTALVDRLHKQAQSANLKAIAISRNFGLAHTSEILLDGFEQARASLNQEVGGR